MTPDKRRSEARHVTCVPVGVKTEDSEELALIRDANAHGALLFVRHALKVGDKVTVDLQLDQQPSLLLEARVLRVEELDSAIWTCAAAVTFEPAREDLAPLFAQLAQRQERLFGSAMK